MRISRQLEIADRELVMHFTRADGPGGQHVNRTESAVELRFDVANSPSLPEPVRERLLACHDHRLTPAGLLVIQARRFREQPRNREDALERLKAFIRAGLKPPKRRIATRPTRASRERRLRGKKHRGDLKAKRQKTWSNE